MSYAEPIQNKRLNHAADLILSFIPIEFDVFKLVVDPAADFSSR